MVHALLSAVAAYTHHKTVGNRDNAAPMQMEVTESSKQGFQGIWPEGPRKGKLGTQHTTFVAPGLMYHDLTSKQFGRTLTVVYATPMRKGEYRKWVQTFQADPFPGQTLGREWTTEALLDRYHSHTQHCSSCSGALKGIKTGRKVALLMSAIAWSAIPLTVAFTGGLNLIAGILLTGLPLSAGAVWLWLGTFEKKLQVGRAIPPRNQLKP